MLPTPRLLAVLLAATALAALGGLPAVAGLLLLLGGLAAAVVDGVLLRDSARVTVRRVVESKLSLGAWNPTRVEVRNGTARRVRVELRDVVPPDFLLARDASAARPGRIAMAWSRLVGRGLRRRRRPLGSVDAPPVPRQPLFALDLGPGEAQTARYRVYPRHRGDHAFGDLHLRVDGPLGLARRQRRLTGSGEQVRVYPNLRELRKYDLMARRGAMLEAGTRALRAPGASTEFERLREYVPDDEFRRINWKATARRGKPIVNQLEAERSQNLVIMVDAGRLMAARATLPSADEAEAIVAGEVETGLTKLDHALNSALLLAYVGGLRGDRVALLAYTDTVRTFIPPTRGRRAFVSMVQALYNVQPEATEADHGLAFQFLAGRNLRRSLVVLFTDLADRESSARLVANLVHAGRHHQVLCVTLGDPTVSRPALARPRDTQTLYEKMVAQRLLDDRATVLATLNQRGVLTIDTDADRLSPRLIGTYLELKQRGRV